MRCSIWRDIKKSSGTMIVDTGCCWCSVPSSLIIRVHLSRILSAETDVHPSPYPLSLPCLVYSHFLSLSLCSISVLCLLPHHRTLSDIIISYHTFTSYHHRQHAIPIASSLLPLSFPTWRRRFVLQKMLLSTSRCNCEYSHFFSFGFYHLGMLRFLHTVIKQNEKDSVFPLWECLFAVKVFNELSVSIFFFVVLSLFWKKCN